MGFSLKSIVKGVESVARVAVAPVTGGLSLAQSKNQVIAIGEANAGVAALVGGAIVAPGAMAAIGGKVGGAALGVGAGVAARRWSGPVNPPQQVPTPTANPSYGSMPQTGSQNPTAQTPYMLQTPGGVTVNSTLAPGGAAPVPDGGSDKLLLLGAAALAAKLLLL